MFLAMAEDIRVVLIKLADRLHNMRTLSALPPEKQVRIARQTLEIYAPLAERLGHLADQVGARGPRLQGPRARAHTASSRRKLDTRRRAPRGVRRAGHRASSSRGLARGRHRGRAVRPPQAHLQHLARRCSARAPSSARSTTSTPSASWSTSVKDCYAALGVVHSLWRPIPGQFDDYIADAQEQRLPEPPHRGDRARRQAARDPDPDPRDAPRLARSASPPTGATRKARAPTATTTPSWPGCASSWTGSARCPTPPSSSRASSSTSSRTRSSSSRRKRRGQGPAGRRDPARLRLSHPHRRRPPLHRRQGQQPPGAARLQAARTATSSRSSRPRASPRSVAGLAEHRPHQPRPREDPAVVQAPGARREHRPRPRVARARAAAPGPDHRSSAIGQDQLAEMADASTSSPTLGRLLRGDRLRRGQRPAGGHAAGRRRRHRDGAAAGRAAAAGAARRRPRQGRRRPADPLRQVLPPHPRRPDRRLHHPRQGRHGPPAHLPDGDQRAGRAPAHRRGVGAPRPADLSRSRSASRPTTGPACCPTSRKWWPSTRSTSWPPT